MREALSADEWEDWRAFYEARPFGEYAQDARFAMIAALIASMASGKSERVERYMLARPPAPPPKFSDIARALHWAAAWGARKET